MYLLEDFVWGHSLGQTTTGHLFPDGAAEEEGVGASRDGRGFEGAAQAAPLRAGGAGKKQL